MKINLKCHVCHFLRCLKFASKHPYFKRCSIIKQITLLAIPIIIIFIAIFWSFNLEALNTLLNYQNCIYKWSKHKQFNNGSIIIVLTIIIIIITLIHRNIIFNKQNQFKHKTIKFKINQLAKKDDLVIDKKLEKINKLYRLASFGRMATGIFHDLINPLTAVSLNLEQIKNSSDFRLLNIKDAINQAIYASHRMEDLINCIKHAIKNENKNSSFSISKEIAASLKLFNYKICQAKIIIIFENDNDIQYYGDVVQFGQVLSNLLSNGIDSLETSLQVKKIIKISCQLVNGEVIISIEDNGPGIKAKHINKIFEPFFTTKQESGIGLGLASVKNITENCFHGTISVSSHLNVSTIFTIKIPLNN